MRLILLITIIILKLGTAEAQYSFRVSMGIDFANTPSLNDYINQNFPVGSNLLSDFNTAIDFSGEFCYSLTNYFQGGLELSYILNSYNFSNELGKFEFDYNIISPSLLGYYVLNGDGYNFKFGGGFGIRFVDVDLTFPGTTATDKYSSIGLGMILRVEGNTLLGGNFYANIGGDLKYDSNGKPQSGNAVLDGKLKGANLNSLAFALRLGLAYIL